MDNIAEEQSKLLDEYADLVEVKMLLPRAKIEKLASSLQRDMLTLSAKSFDPEAEVISTVKLRARLAADLSYFFSLLDADVLEEASAKGKAKGKKVKLKTAKKARNAAPVQRD